MTLTTHAPSRPPPAARCRRFPPGSPPSSAGGQDYATDRLDFVEILVRDAGATYVIAVEGSSLLDAGIAHGDLIIVDRGLEPVHHDIVLVDDDGTVQRFLRQTPQRVYGAPAMPPQLSTALNAGVGRDRHLPALATR
ncbi:hypothetical protein NBM05_07455 [Rothia sp. AR01]|uniref:Peptidase S24/S26A/S26B/S26C domain-containing protein n=1 Tax=Rothia santali TaxID=2949643 RepID=A0A9X2HDT2_9MICC|nr:S24 family peptidase [Rothia santali]MCP3425847.1 hypothetical protein [Rothia santali]